MKLALVQFAPVFGDIAENRRKMQGLWPDDVDLVVFPELCLSGYLFENREEAYSLGENLDGPTLSWAKKLCVEKKSAVVYGFAERDGDKLYNSAVLVKPDGNATLYRKMHLFYKEKECFDSGNLGWSVTDVCGCKVGLMICFDWRFPESARTLALKGAELIAHPSNLVQPYCQAAMITRCLENKIFAATANRIGSEARAGMSFTYTGESQVASPSGKILVKCTLGSEQVETVEIDPDEARDKSVAGINDLFADRRPEHYKRIIEE